MAGPASQLTAACSFPVTAVALLSEGEPDMMGLLDAKLPEPSLYIQRNSLKSSADFASAKQVLSSRWEPHWPRLIMLVLPGLADE